MILACTVVGAVTVAVLLFHWLPVPAAAAILVAGAFAATLAFRPFRLPGDRSPGPRTSEDLGIQASNGISPLAPRGTRLPFETGDRFSTEDDDQPSIEIRLVATGALAQQRTVALVTHPILKPGPRGVPQLRVVLKIDEAGAIMLEVTEASFRTVHYRGESIGVVDASIVN